MTHENFSRKQAARLLREDAQTAINVLQQLHQSRPAVKQVRTQPREDPHTYCPKEILQEKRTAAARTQNSSQPSAVDAAGTVPHQ